MKVTHTYTHLKGFLASHAVAAEALTLGAVLGIMASLSPSASYQAHFMARPAQTQQISSSSSSSSSVHRPVDAQARREQRLAQRKREAMIAHTATLAQRSAPYLALNEMRPAAPAEEAASSAPVVIEISSAASSMEPASSASSEHSAASDAPMSASSSSAVSSAEPVTEAPVPVQDPSFPAFGRSMHPVSKVPDWGAMTTPQQWNRTYKQMTTEDFVRVPSYDLRVLKTPMDELQKDRFSEETIRILTAKLYYSTRHFGAYHLDAGEFSAVHPGIDLKLPEGMPVGAVAGGRVHDVRRNEKTLGIHVIIEHRAPDGESYYSIYGHLQDASVKRGDAVTAGQMIGLIGMTGHTTGPHLHLQIDKRTAGEAEHAVYWPASLPSSGEASRHTVNPMQFIRSYADGQ